MHFLILTWLFLKQFGYNILICVFLNLNTIANFQRDASNVADPILNPPMDACIVQSCRMNLVRENWGCKNCKTKSREVKLYIIAWIFQKLCENYKMGSIFC